MPAANRGSDTAPITTACVTGNVRTLWNTFT
jgi:hypothetical protein